MDSPSLPMAAAGAGLPGGQHGDQDGIAPGQGLRYRLVATRANGQPAFGIYVHDPHSGVLHANGLMVLALAGNRISAITRFDNSNLARFGLPRTLDA